MEEFPQKKRVSSEDVSATEHIPLVFSLTPCLLIPFSGPFDLCFNALKTPKITFLYNFRLYVNKHIYIVKTLQRVLVHFSYAVCISLPNSELPSAPSLCSVGVSITSQRWWFQCLEDAPQCSPARWRYGWQCPVRSLRRVRTQARSAAASR